MSNTGRLLRTWAMLMSLSLAFAIVADATRPTRLSHVALLLVGVVAVLKARLVLADYLGLRATPAALAGFSTAIVAIFALVVLSFEFPVSLFVRQ